MCEYKMLVLTESQITWIAGLLEGEGYFGIDNRSKDRYDTSKSQPAPYIRLVMTDEDVVAKLSNLVDKPYFIPQRKTLKGKTVYVLHIGNREKVLFILEKILPHMGKRRSERIKECISYIN